MEEIALLAVIGLGLVLLVLRWRRDRAHSGLACMKCGRPIRAEQQYVQVRGSLYHTGCRPRRGFWESVGAPPRSSRRR